MPGRSDVSEFLKTRRARITPAQAGIRELGRARRVPGLKREEVAMLAGVSTEYYARLERGALRGVSDSVLNALARALQLDEAERAHLFELARAASAPERGRRRAGQPGVRPSIARLLETMSETPAYVRNARFDILMANRPCLALYDGVFSLDTLPFNLARYVFLDPHAKDFFGEWERVAEDITAALRIEAGRSPGDPGLSLLVGDLATGSESFATRWARHDVRFHVSSTKRLCSSLLGEIELTGDALDLGDGLTVIAYTAEPGSRDSTCIHHVDAGGGGAGWSGFDLARHQFYLAWADLPESAGHTWRNGANVNWGNTVQMMQCDQSWAGSNGDVGFYRIPNFYH